jgi:hypothetical protein
LNIFWKNRGHTSPSERFAHKNSTNGDLIGIGKQ